MILLVFIVVAVFIICIRFHARLLRLKHDRDGKTVGFFHPYSNGGGGGERVLWMMIEAVQRMSSDVHCVVYTGDNISAAEQVLNVKKHFNIELPRPIELVHLPHRGLVEAKRYPVLTMVMQSIGSMLLAFEALWKRPPTIFIDTVGYAFTFPVAKLLFGCKVACYVHYPTISTDMLSRVSERRATYNNSAQVTSSSLKTYLKLVYYHVFAMLYGLVGYFADVVMVNSTWTFNHIRSLWYRGRSNRSNGSDIQIVYPPVNVSRLVRIPLNKGDRKRIILSVAQFRPEKDHRLQLEAFAKLLRDRPQYRHDGGNEAVRLVLLGGCRDDSDHQRVNELKALAEQLNISTQVEFVINAPYETLYNYLSEALIGLHSMWNEHFGIGIVEYMAAGLVTLAHNSGGPQQDIVVKFQNQTTGYLAESVDEYAERMHRILSMYVDADKADELFAIQTVARESAARFSEEHFVETVVNCLRPIIVNQF